MSERMPMVLTGRDGAGRETARIRRPLLWSATVHLAALSVSFALGAGTGVAPFRGVVEVILVGGSGREEAVAVRSARDAPPAPVEPSVRPAVSRPVPPVLEEPAPVTAGEGVPVPAEGAGRREPGIAPVRPVGETRPGTEESAPASTVGDRESGYPRGGTETVALREGSPAYPGSGGEAPVFLPGGASGGSGPGQGPATAALGPGDVARDGTGADRLRERIQSRIVYPEEAVRRGQQGEVLLRIRIGTGGIPKEIRIARSSGTRLLDEAARRGVVRAAPLPSDPGWVEVPVRFRLR